MTLEGVKKVYLAGIGGSSMSSLAEILYKRGYSVCGSDMQTSATTDRLSSLGIKVYIGHSENNVKSEQPDVIVRTDAVMENNPEIAYALQAGIPVHRRAELLGLILDGYKTPVGVAGTHGKTTTSGMISSIIAASGADYSAIIGGKVKHLESSYIIGKEDNLCVFESCEYKDSFHCFKPFVSVILNIAEDHMEYFKTLENLIGSFRKYLSNTKDGGWVVYNAECQNSLTMIDGYKGQKVSYGIVRGEVTSSDIFSKNGLYSFTVMYHGEKFCDVSLSVPGEHNIKNALAAAAAAIVLGISPEAVSKGLHDFAGTKRRFEYHCTVNGAVIADDYAHHPDAYEVTFKTARELGFKRIIAIHQPHTFSRTKMLMNDFAKVLSQVDHVIIPPIYAARETNDEYNVYAEDLVALLPNAEYQPDFEHIAQRVKEMAQPGDLFITLGCGNIYLAAELIARKYRD
ncbi:MAG: UDP-N-acetylmuramate--L-alanine ligase [Clostridia bacterium]|nr:UDP-N-acetylmuramate--L-alanine ligase [Clostridia bacterium]